jgi:hypothetical protein
MNKVVINTGESNESGMSSNPSGASAVSIDDKNQGNDANQDDHKPTDAKPVVSNDDTPVVSNDDTPVVDTLDETKADDSVIEIDDKQYNLDESGNAINEAGEVIYSKDQIDKFDEVNDTSTFKLDDIFKDTNIIPLDESGEQLVYEQSSAGLSSYIKDVHGIGKQEGIDEYQQQLFDTYPILNDVLSHLYNNNGSLDNFTPSVKYTNVEINDEFTEQHLKNIILSGRLDRGEDQEKAEKYFKYLQDSNQVKEEAASELKYLQAREADKESRQAEEHAAKQEQELQNASQYWGIEVDKKGQLVDLNKNDSIYGVIKSGVLKVDNETYNIPDKIRIKEGGKVVIKDKSEFFKYLYEPLQYKRGNESVKMTKYEYDLEVENTNRSVHNDIFDAFRRFVKYDVGQLVKEKVNQEEVKRIVKKVNTRKSGSTVKSERSDGKIIIPRIA